jgi:hypothetical protein
LLAESYTLRVSERRDIFMAAARIERSFTWAANRAALGNRNFKDGRLEAEAMEARDRRCFANA